MASATKSIVAKLNKDLMLNGDIYNIWQQKVKFILMEQDVLVVLTNVVKNPLSMLLI